MKYQNDRKYKRENTFSADLLKKPATEFFPAYNWSWGSLITKEGIKTKIDEMCEKNIKIFYILPSPKDFRPKTNPSELEPDYLTEEYFDVYKYAV